MLDDLRRARFGVLRIEAGRPAGGALVKQVVGPVELDLDRLESLVLLGCQPMAVAGVLPEMLLFIGQGVDPSEDVVVEHGRLLASR